MEFAADIEEKNKAAQENDHRGSPGGVVECRHSNGQSLNPQLQVLFKPHLLRMNQSRIGLIKSANSLKPGFRLA